MRPIDAEALSEKLCETTIFIKDGEVFQRMINDAPTVSADAVKGWIPCYERLPEKDELVLVTVWNDVTIAWRNIYGGWDSAEDMYEKGDVTAWMPLPKPYREESEVMAIEALQAPTDGDLIRREGILHELAELSDSYEKQYPREKEMIHGLILICRKAILNYPSADRPTEAFGTMCGQSNQAIEYALEHIKADRPTGEWIHDGVDVEGGVDWMHCSNCGKSDVWADATRTNYCPNCGARMKGGAE